MGANNKDIGQSSQTDLARMDAYESAAADYEEIPELTDADLARGMLVKRSRGRPPLGEAPKEHVTLRLDQDIVEHFRETGAGWQARINAELRRAVRSAKRAPRPSAGKGAAR